MYIVEMPCETCGKLRKFKRNIAKIFNYREKCIKCVLTERNKKQIFTKRKYPIYDNFKEIDTQEKAYIFGYLWADAYLSCNFNGKNREKPIKSIIMGLSYKDECVIDFIIKNIGGSKAYKETIDKRNDTTSKQYVLSIHSKDVYDNLMNLNFRKNIDLIPKHLYNHFIRGLFDGDGCIIVRKEENRYNHIQLKITSNYEQDWDFLKSIIKKYSISQRIDKRGSKYSNFNINGNKNEKIDFLKWLYKDSIFHLERKYDKIKHLII